MEKMKSLNLTTIALALFAAVDAPAFAGPLVPNYSAPLPIYSVKDVGFLPGEKVMRGVSINFEGDIVGSGYSSFQPESSFEGTQGGSGTNQHGFLYHHGRLTDLGAGIMPMVINNWGEILESDAQNAFLYKYRSGRYTPLPNGGIDLNNAGEVLIPTDDGTVTIRRANGEVVSHTIAVNAGFNPGYAFFDAWAINDLGQAVGRHFTYPVPPPEEDQINDVDLVQPNGSFRIIAASGDNNYCFPRAVNLLGQAVGADLNQYWNVLYQDYFYDSGDAALYVDGQNILLGNLLTQAEGGAAGNQPPGSRATAINNLGVVVGYCQGVGEHESLSKAFLWLNGTMYDLNTLLDASGKGLTITEAWGINDLGQIVALAKDSAGDTHTVLLSVAGFKHSSFRR